MDIFSSFATDETLENQGKTFQLDKTTSVLVARSGNKKYVTLLRAKMAEAQLELLSGEAADQLAEDIIIDVMSQTVLLGWSGVTDANGPVTYSTAKAAEYLKIKDFRKKIQSLSENFEAYKVKAAVEQKND